MDVKRYDLLEIKGHLPELDGLRGLAIGLVLLFHLFPFLPFSRIGWIGVDLFFVLSGFLISGILQDSLNKRRYWFSFFIRRALRIFPLYYFILLLYVGLSYISADFAALPVVSFDYFKDNQVWYWTYLSNIKMFIEGRWLPPIVFNPLWSLSIEEQFYLLWPLVIYLFRNKKLLYFIFFLLSVVIAIRVHMVVREASSLSIYVFTFARLDAILLGSMVSVFIRNEKLRALLEKYNDYFLIGSVILILGIAISFRTFSAYQFVIQSVGYTIIAVFFCCILILVLNKNKNFILDLFFKSKPMIFLGKYSYALYLFHWPLYRLLREPVQKLCKEAGVQIAANIFTSLVILSLTCLASLITWNLFEKRFIQLKSKFPTS